MSSSNNWERTQVKDQAWSPSETNGHLLDFDSSATPIEWHKNVHSSRKNRRLQKQSVGQVYVPQGSFLENLCDISHIGSKGVYRKYFKYCESALALYGALAECTSTSQAASIIVLYLKTFNNESWVFSYTNLLEILFDGTKLRYTYQSGSDIPDIEGDMPQWLLLLKKARDNWPRVTSHEAFNKVSTLMSLVISLGICEASDLEFSIKGVKLFSVQAMPSHYTATDMFSAAVETVIYFVEVGHQCFTTGSLSPLFSKEADGFDELYFRVIELAPSVKTGNLEKVFGVSENDYSLMLGQAVDLSNALIKGVKPGWEKRVLEERRTRLVTYQAEFTAYRVNGELREAPYAIYIYGSSGVGKSSVAKLLMCTTLASNGYCADDDRLITLNESDKYMSTYKSHMNGVFIDDLGNTKADYLDASPCSKLIELINNVPAYANMAEADMKGKVSIQPKSIVMTSNVELARLGRQYSNEPYSIVRRCDVHIMVEVKPEFQLEGERRLDSSKVREVYGDDLPVAPDIWDFTIFVPNEKASDYLIEVKKCGIVDLLAFVASRSKSHFTNQRTVLDINKNVAEKLQVCKLCSLPAVCCQCQQVGFIANSLPFPTSITQAPWWFYYMPRVHVTPAGILSRLFFSLKYRGQFQTLCFLPILVFVLSSFFLCATPGLLLLLNAFSVLFCMYFHVVAYNKALTSLVGTRVEWVQSARSRYLTHFLAGSGAIAAIYMLAKLWKKFRSHTPHGNLSPTSYEDVESRDEEVNPWKGMTVSPVPGSDVSKVTNHDDLVNVVAKNLCYVEIIIDDKIAFCDALFIKSNVALVPNHMVPERECPAIFYKYNCEKHGASFKGILSRVTSYHIPGTDLCLIYVPSGGSWKDLMKWFPLGDTPTCPVSFVYKKKNGSLMACNTMAKLTDVRTSVEFRGYEYKTTFPTFKGLCMGTLISQNIAPSIIGFHLGGRTGYCDSVAGTVNLSQLEKGLEQLSFIPGVTLVHNQGKMLTKQYGVSFHQGYHLDPKSPCNFLDDLAVGNCYGSVIGRATFRSVVVPTTISPIVKEVCGVPQQWAGPKFHAWKPWRDTIVHAFNPTIGLPPSQIQWAVRDYLSPLILSLKGKFKEEIAPLTDLQAVCGIDGRRFIDKIKPQTALGFPLTGPKTNRIIYLDPEEHEGFDCPFTFTEEIWEEVHRYEQVYANGERVYPIFKASLKDEPTKIGKDKVRVFQASPIAFQILIRKYYLPICRYLSLFPLLSECACGVNAFGPEWDELARHIVKQGRDRILAGDYSKYDLRTSAQLTLAAFDVLITLAKFSSNYSESDLTIMRGIATDVVYPVTAYNGDLLEFLGSNPSGQNLTVYINSIVNSLNLRCGFLHCTGLTTPPPFRDVCSFATYGDDVKGSVHKDYVNFNHISFADYMGSFGMVFTMPDKESTPVAFMRDDEADFLKRSNRYDEELGLYRGPLDEKSIFKSLHAVLRSKALTPDQQSATNIDGALREWFVHGREVYDRRRLQMEEIANRAGLAHMVPGLYDTYDDRLSEFKLNYMEPNPDVSPGDN